MTDSDDVIAQKLRKAKSDGDVLPSQMDGLRRPGGSA